MTFHDGDLRMEIEFDYTSNDASASAEHERERMARFVACLQVYIGHELPNQLVSIQAFARMLLEDHSASLDAEARMMLERLADLTEQSDTVARRLAEIGRLLRESPWGLPLPVDEVVREAVAEVNAFAVDSGVTFEVPTTLPSVNVSRDLLYQTLGCLIKNAVEALSGKSGTVMIGARRETNGVSLWVRDSGRGMSDDQAGLFEPFAAGRFPGARGPGLGLFLVCQAVARWGGKLHVQSRVGQGSTFTLFIPEHGKTENQWTA